MTVDAETLRQWMEAGKPLTILDVRPQTERTEWSIPGSLHVDAYDALRAHDPRELDSVALPLDRPVVTMCAAGRTSLLAADVLRARGHVAYSLSGGMKAWTGAWNTAEVPAGAPGVRIIQVRRTGKGCLSYVVGPDDTTFCEWMARDVGVAAVPGSSFFNERVQTWIRFHFAKKVGTLVEAGRRLRRIRDAWAGRSGRG